MLIWAYLLLPQYTFHWWPSCHQVAQLPRSMALPYAIGFDQLHLS